MSVIVYANNYSGEVHKNAFEATAYAKKIADQQGTHVVAVVMGPSSNASELGKYGAKNVLHYSNQTFTHLDPSKFTAAMASVVESEGADIVIFSHDFSGKSIAPRLSARLKAGHVSGAVDYPDTADGFVVKKAVFSGKAFAFVSIESQKKIISLLPNSITIEEMGESAEIKEIGEDLGDASLNIKEIKKESTKMSLTEAELVVSAGRGLKGPENWKMIEEFAELLGAATACSRPVADIGWRPHHEHVGQTGIAIRPNLYIAIGISGAIQHLAGVNGSKVIVVINIDPEAPFFKAADYGIVGDAFDVVPKLVEAARNYSA